MLNGNGNGVVPFSIAQCACWNGTSELSLKGNKGNLVISPARMVCDCNVLDAVQDSCNDAEEGYRRKC